MGLTYDVVRVDFENKIWIPYSYSYLDVSGIRLNEEMRTVFVVMLTAGVTMTLLGTSQIDTIISDGFVYSRGIFFFTREKSNFEK